MRLTKTRINHIVNYLQRMYPKVSTPLLHKNPFELLVATILSAQCTDKRVNMVTPVLFQSMPTPEHFVKAELAEIEDAIRSINFFRNKAKNIQASCALLLAKHQGQVPCTMEALVSLPGVGRKTANVVLSEAFGMPGVVVDTHVKRVSKRLGLTEHTDPTKIEKDLTECLPREIWHDFSLQLIFLGRSLCTARKPKCPECPLREWCDYGRKRGRKGKKTDDSKSKDFTF